MYFGTYSGIFRTTDGVMRDGCCCALDYCYGASVVLPCPKELEIKGNYGLSDIETWQSYCMRGAYWKDQAVSGYYDDDNVFRKRYNGISLNGWERCVAMTGRTNGGGLTWIDPELVFGDCISLLPYLRDDTIDWRCLDVNDVFDPLAEVIPDALIGKKHKVIAKVDYHRLILGDDGGGNWRSADYHAFYIQLFAFFEL